jgi:hypothetical protein
MCSGVTFGCSGRWGRSLTPFQKVTGLAALFSAFPYEFAAFPYEFANRFAERQVAFPGVEAGDLMGII